MSSFKQMTLVKIFFYSCILLVSLSCEKKQIVHVRDTGAFQSTPTLYSTDINNPLKILSEGQWGREIEGGVYGSQGATPDTPLGLKTVSLPIFMTQAGKGPLTIHLQYSGFKNKVGRHNYGADLPTIIEVHCPDTVETCGSTRLGQQAFMPLGSDKPSQYDWTEITKDGQVKYLLVGEKDVKFDMPSDKIATIYLLFLVPKDIETQYMKATVFYGEYSKTPPKAKPFYESEIFVKVLKFVWLFVPILFGLFYKAYEGIPENTPKILGGYFIFSGTVTCLVFASAHSCGLGLLVAFTGVFLVYGHSIALTIYVFVVLLVWGPALSVFAKDDNYRHLIMNVWIVTAFALYLYSNRVRQRLG